MTHSSDDSPVGALRSTPGFTGELITPDHDDYDTARAVWNGLVDRHPALNARCAGTADVVACVNVARDLVAGYVARIPEVAEVLTR